MQNDIRARESTKVQAAPVDLEHGRFEPRQVVSLFAIALGGTAAGALGGLVMSWGAAGADSDWGWLAALSTWAGIFGALLLALGWALAAAVATLAARGWWRHQARVDDWHYAQLAAYEAAGGQQVERELSMRSLSLSEPLHVLAVALHVVERARAGQGSPWASTALRGDIWYGRLKLGELGKRDAEQFSAALATMGIVKGRRAGSAGALATTDLAQVLELVAKNYGKVAPGELARPELSSEDD